MASLKNLFTAKDLTQGAPWKRIVEFSIPLLIGNVVQQFYNTVDSIIVGMYIGDNALAAVGSAMPVLHLLLVLFVGISVGAGIQVSQYFGAKDRANLSHTIGICITLTAITTGAVMLIGPLVSRPLLELLNTPPSIIDWCSEYLNILFIGAAGFLFYNIFAGILRGFGDSASALLFLVISTLLNVVLDIWFVAGFGLGVPGVALATALAQAFSAVLCLLKLMRMKEHFDLSWAMLKPGKDLTLRLLKLGLPSGLTQAIFSLALIAVQSLTNSFGELVIACNVIVMRIDGFAMMPNFSFGAAMTTFAGQNFGAKRYDRVAQGARDGTKIAVAVAAVITIGILLFGRYLMSIFTSTEELVNISMRMMRILAPGYIAMAVTQCLAGVMRGVGDTVTPMWISLFTSIGLRVPLAYSFAYFTRSELYPTGRPESVFVSLLIAWILGSVVTAVFYRRGKWRRETSAESQVEAQA